MTAFSHWHLDAWLAHQQAQHSQAIDMTLERARAVAKLLDLAKPAPLVITVAGTNGKGSTVAFLQALLAASGLRVGCYTSPQVLHYRERIALPGRWVTDAELIKAFTQIENARIETGVGLTFFEYATLAAWRIFSDSDLDVVVLEVGLGGRLDTVNLIDADGAILTTVDLDHQEFLGHTRAEIGLEKAGIFRVLQTAVYADREPVGDVLAFADKLGVKLLRPKRDYRFHETANEWRYQFGAPGSAGAEMILPKPKLAAPCQLDNAAAAITLLLALRQTSTILNIDAISAALRQAHVPGRLERVGERPDIYLDVAHNPQGGFSLAQWLYANPSFGRTLAVYGALADKDVLGVVSELKHHVHQWFLTGLETHSPRGLDALALTAHVRGATRGNYDTFAGIELALDAAIHTAKSTDRILVFGSFYMVAAAYRALGIAALPAFEFQASLKLLE
jgi:dihydrofolate synthase / folylpolyglutamate synthase